MTIENYAGRNRYRFNPKISLRIDTSPDQIRFILLELKKLLYAHSKVADSPLRARFAGVVLTDDYVKARVKIYRFAFLE